jgi:hypothetical protein
MRGKNQEMTSSDELEKELRKITDGLRCSKDFKCYRSGFENLCKAKIAGTEAQILICLEKQPQKCKFLNLVGGYICECPLRIYVSKKLKK